MSNRLLIFCIFFLASFLRFWHLGLNPPSLTWDEAAWGYNSYSLGIDGRDEFGRFLPYDYLESFGDFKPPVYAYMGVIPVKIFGLNEFAVRFPSAFFGVLTVLLTYFLTKRIFHNKSDLEFLFGITKTDAIALSAAFFLAISPWHVNLSRAAFEANVSTFFLVTGVWAFLAGVQEKPKLLVFSAVSFVVSLYTFNTARIVAPLLVIILTIGFYKELFKIKKEALLAGAIGVLMLFPIVGFLSSPQAQLRFKEVNIFSDIGIIERTNLEIENDKNAWWSKIIHNRRLAYAAEFVKHYLDNVTPSFLFIKGDGNPKFSTQDVGQLYLWDLPFIIVGLLFIFRKRIGNWWILPLWFVLGIIPAATARETPHALRIETTLPTLQIFIAFGFVELLHKISNIKKQIAKIQIKHIIFTATFLFLFFNFSYYIHGYYMHYPREFSGEWQYGYRDSIQYVLSVQHKYEKIYITPELGRPYIYYLFYTKTHPNIFRKKDSVVKRDSFGFVTVESFGKYYFTNDLSRREKDVLFINAPGRVPDKASILKTFFLKNGDPILVAYVL